jgi:murein DD-endopeptidase MepM/ murein hydrolase activator NlpD
MTRRGILAVAIVLISALLVPVVSIGAPAQSAASLEAQLAKLKKETKAAGASFDRAYWKLDESEVKLAKTDKQIAATRKELARARKQLNRHAAAIYRRDSLDEVSFLVNATSFQELITRMEYMRRIGEADAKTIMAVTKLSQKLTTQRASLAKEQKSRKAALSGLRSQRDKLQKQLRSKQAAFVAVKKQLDAVRGGPNRPTDVAAQPGPNGMVFPVVGAYYYANTWGASRSGGRRRHQGTDIMAARGTPCVAMLAGTVRSKSGGLGGKTIWLTANNGWEMYYAHLDGWAVRSGRVKAGQVIGYVGSTGNAAGGAPHLHFEIHPGGGGPVNPYPYLRSME